MASSTFLLTFRLGLSALWLLMHVRSISLYCISSPFHFLSLIFYLPLFITEELVLHFSFCISWFSLRKESVLVFSSLLRHSSSSFHPTPCFSSRLLLATTVSINVYSCWNSHVKSKSLAKSRWRLMLLDRQNSVWEASFPMLFCGTIKQHFIHTFISAKKGRWVFVCSCSCVVKNLILGAMVSSCKLFFDFRIYK